MPAVNPDPYRNGRPFLPERCVTAIFANVATSETAVSKLREVGFDGARVQLYTGERGAEQLDVDGQKLSGLEKALQAITQALADDAGYLERASGTLKKGGALVQVDTGDEEPEVRRAASVLKSAGGDDVQHWGKWRTEQF